MLAQCRIRCPTCDLLAHVPVSLERGAQRETVRTFKLSALDAVEQIVNAIRTSGALHGPSAIRDLIAIATALASSLWQTAHPNTDPGTAICRGSTVGPLD